MPQTFLNSSYCWGFRAYPGTVFQNLYIFWSRSSLNSFICLNLHRKLFYLFIIRQPRPLFTLKKWTAWQMSPFLLSLKLHPFWYMMILLEPKTEPVLWLAILSSVLQWVFLWKDGTTPAYGFCSKDQLNCRQSLLIILLWVTHEFKLG